MYEMIWSNQPEGLKAFVKKTETEGLYWYEVRVKGVKALVGAMTKDDLVTFLPSLRMR